MKIRFNFLSNTINKQDTPISQVENIVLDYQSAINYHKSDQYQFYIFLKKKFMLYGLCAHVDLNNYSKLILDKLSELYSDKTMKHYWFMTPRQEYSIIDKYYSEINDLDRIVRVQEQALRPRLNVINKLLLHLKDT